MPFYFTCPHCLHKTLVDEQLSGQRGPCVSCGKQVLVIAPPRRAAENIAPAEEQFAPTFVQPRRRLLSPTAVKTGIFIIASLPILIFGIWMLAPTIMQLKTRRDIASCKQNLSRIARALNAYAADYGSYPPPITRDASGRPMHSWRVLILPYLSENRLYKAYDLSEPWDSPNNAMLQARIPSVYVSPAKTNAGVVGESSYALVTGASTIFLPTGPLSPGVIGDGADNTLLVVESNNTRTPWTSPTDLDIAVLPAQIGALGGIGGTHQGGATVVFADGQAGWLPADTNSSIVHGLLSPNGGETVRGSWFQ